MDPDGRSTWVVANPDGTYTIEGGNLDDNDLNIYVVTYDEDGNMIIGESIGKTSSITSFYDGDKDDNNEIKGWKTGSVINPNDRSGWEFISELVITDPSLVEYMLGARKNERYDFKVTNGTNTKVADIDIYRGMPIFKDVNGTVIYSSARDVGNILAGFIAGKKGLSWGMSRLGFDGYQMLSDIRNKKWPRPEGTSTRNAQYLGWKIAVKR